MAKPSRSHDALQQLLDERKRYEQWIATLESRRESTPENVFKRVHADYDQRLTVVRQQLTERTGEIRSAISGLKDRLKQASEQEAERVDEMQEAELRSAVGELTPEQWELRKREVEVELTRFGDDKKKISEELNQLLLVMEQAADHGMDSGPAASAPPSATPVPAVSTPSSATHVPAVSTPPSAAPVPAVSTPPSAAPVPPAAPVPAASTPPATAVPADATRVRSKTPARSRASAHNGPPVPLEAEKPPVPIESLAPAAAPVAPAAAPAKPSKSSGAAQPMDPRRENDKTLKCGECGAMNYPTEWYCESCGGELSAL